MKKIMFGALIALITVSFSSCTKNLSDTLVGTWNVTEVKAEPTSGSASSTTNAGTMTFASGGSGSYSIIWFGTTSSGNFTWTAADNGANVTISGFTIVSGAYTVITNQKKKQVWQRLDSNGTKYTYTLEK